MLHIIGWILKCILILLGLLLGLALLLVTTLLFVPLRYEGKAEFPGEVENITARLKVTWLFHLLYASVDWEEGELNWKLRAAWKRFGEDPEDVSETEAETRHDSEPDSDSESDFNSESHSDAEQNSGSSSESSGSPKEKQKTVERKTKTEQKDVSKEKQQKEGLFTKIKKKIKEFWKRIKYTIRKIYDKIKEGMDLKNEILTFLEEKVHKKAFLKLKKELNWLKRFFRITKAKVKLRFGFEDPSVTGQVLGALSILYALIEGNIEVVPDFEEKCLEGQISFKGRSRMIYIIIPIVRLIADKTVRQTYKDFKDWKES